ncbi:hypothetical protein [Flavobacterium gelatinilyticum]|uniref:hypothetical protein n=1 Tax=Flavobacterium gelatinilyticum TaxID=3003260 RepID=UPI0024812A80|nr:hypothetical protein [Flavobacterium gelatinilyticum]
MALNKQELNNNLKDLLTDMLTKEENSIEEFASRMSDAVEKFVKSGTVNVTVQTTGTASSQSGTGTGSIT